MGAGIGIFYGKKNKNTDYGHSAMCSLLLLRCRLDWKHKEQAIFGQQSPMIFLLFGVHIRKVLLCTFHFTFSSLIFYI